MTTHQPPTDWEDSIDLRVWINALIRRWWLITAIVTAFIVVAVIYSYGFQESVYESSGGAILPPGSSEMGIGLTPQGYQEFASSTPVMESVNEKLGLGMNAGQLRNHYSFQVNENNFISVNATAESAEQAFRLTNAWIDAYDQQVQAHLQQEFVQRKSELAERTDLLLTNLTSASEKLTEFDLANPASVMESQQIDMQNQLLRDKQRLRELNMNLIPGSEARLASLEEQSAEDIGAVGGGGAPSAIGSTSPGRSAFAPVEEPNPSPAYFDLTQSLMRSQLSDLESDLVDGESSLRQLTLTDIPVAEVRLDLLREARSDEPEFLTVPPSTTSSSGATVPNPVYVQLSEEFATTELLLETAKKEAEILGKKVLVLQQQIGEIRSELLTQQTYARELRLQADALKEKRNLEAELAARHNEVTRLEATIPELEDQVINLRRHILASNVTRQELENEAARLTEEYSVAKDRLTSLLAVEPSLTHLSSLSTIREPSLPADPISPNRSRNIALVAFLGLLVGVGAVLSWDFYRAQPASSPKA